MSKKQRIALAVPDSWFLKELADAAARALSDLGYYANVLSDGDPGCRESDRLILFADGRRLPKTAALMAKTTGSRPEVILWQTEPLLPAGLDEFGERAAARVLTFGWDRLSRMRKRLVRKESVRRIMAEPLRWQLARAEPRWGDVSDKHLYLAIAQWNWIRRSVAASVVDRVVVTTQTRADFLKGRGVPAQLVPFGCYPQPGDRAVRDIDVVFVGRVNNTRRQRIVGDLVPQLKARGIELSLHEYGCTAIERTALLNRAKVALDLGKVPWDIAGIRLMMSSVCGALVVTDFLDDCPPYLDGTHYVSASHRRLADTIERFVRHEEQRAQVVERASAYWRDECTLSASLQRLLAGSPG